MFYTVLQGYLLVGRFPQDAEETEAGQGRQEDWSQDLSTPRGKKLINT